MAILAFGAVLISLSLRNADREMRADLLQQGRLAAQAVNVDRVKGLSGTPRDLNSPYYLRLKDQFAAFRQYNHFIKSIPITRR